MKKAMNGSCDRSQNMGPNCGIFFRLLDSREPLETDVGCYVGIYALNFVLMSRRPEIGMKFGSTKRNR